MNQQQQQQSMFATNGGINNGMMMGATPGFVGGIQANSAGGSTWSDIKGSVNISLDSLAPHSTLQPRGQAGPTLAQMQQNNVQINSLTMQMGQSNIGGLQSMPMGGMMSPQTQQMGFGAPTTGTVPGFGGSSAQPMMSPTSTAKQNLQKKADQAFAELAVFK